MIENRPTQPEPKVLGNPEGYTCEYCHEHLPANRREFWGTGMGAQLNVIYSRPEHDCEAKRQARAQAVEVARKQLLERLTNPSGEVMERTLRTCHLPQRTKPGLQALTVTDDNRHAIETAKSYVQDFAAGKRDRGLYIHGPLGTGKSTLLAALGFSLHVHTGRYQEAVEPWGQLDLVNWGPQCRPLYWSVSGWFRAVQESWDQRHSTEGHYAQRAQTCDVLLWDDLGKQHDTAWKISELFGVIDDRYSECRPTCFTSNYSLPELMRHMIANLGETHASSVTAMLDRIQETCTVIELQGDSWRQR